MEAMYAVAVWNDPPPPEMQICSKSRGTSETKAPTPKDFKANASIDEADTQVFAATTMILVGSFLKPPSFKNFESKYH